MIEEEINILWSRLTCITDLRSDFRIPLGCRVDQTSKLTAKIGAYSKGLSCEATDVLVLNRVEVTAVFGFSKVFCYFIEDLKMPNKQ